MVQYLDVRIRRTDVLQDAMNQLLHRPGDMKKPLRVTFISGGVDEEGLDEGGVTKEFFQLLIRQIFNEVHCTRRLLCLPLSVGAFLSLSSCLCLCAGEALHRWLC